MKKLVNVRKEYRLNGGEWTDTSICNHIRYKEESECVTKTSEVITNWADALEYVASDKMCNSTVEHTFFRNIPYLRLPKNSCLDYPWREVKEKEFKSLEVRVIYLEFDTNLKALAELLSADEFCQYLKDRGLNTCPMMK